MTSLHDFIRSVFGFNRNINERNETKSGPMIGFHVFTNPVEMHRYFEKQLDEFMKGFHQSDLGNDSVFGDVGPSLDSFISGFNDSILSGSGEFVVPHPKDKAQPSDDKNLRDFYLRPEFKSSSNGEEEFRDSDLDGKIDPKDIGEILSRPSDCFSSVLDPFSSDAHPHISIFGKMVTSQTIHHPDGTVETQKTVKESQGKEEKITTFQKGDQSYSITILRDVNGEEKRFENFINIDEDKIPEFQKIFDSRDPMLSPPGNQPSDLLGPPAGRSDNLSYWFNKFFKN